jgi:hypothetical protein
MVLAVTSAEYIKDYKIKLVFSDKNERIINFQPFLEQARNPMTRKFLDINEFKNFTLEYGDLVWNDYEMCFPIIDLYEDRILKDLEFTSAA